MVLRKVVLYWDASHVTIAGYERAVGDICAVYFVGVTG